MGIKGLTHYLSNKFYSSIKPINISKLKEKSEILIDGYSFLYYLYQNSNLDWLYGGEYQLFNEYISEILDYFQSFQLIFIFDGIQSEEKLKMKKIRSEKKGKFNSIIFSTRLGESIPDRDFNNEIIFHLPLFSLDILLNQLKNRKNIEIIQSNFEADPYMAKLSKEKNCYVLSNDSDFMIFQCKGLILMNELEFKKETKELYCIIITNEILSYHLEIDIDLLPILACLSGNDFIDKNLLLEFHQSLINKYKGPKNNHVHRIGLYLRDLKNKKDILKTIFKKEHLDLVQNVYNLYSGKIEIKEIEFKDEKLIERYKEMNLSSEILSLILNKKIYWIQSGIIESDKTNVHKFYKEIKMRYYQCLLNQDIEEYYSVSYQYLRHFMKIEKLTKELTKNEIYSYIWNQEFINDPFILFLFPLKYFIKNRIDLLDFELDCLIASFLILNVKEKKLNVLYNYKLLELSTQIQFGLYLSKLINQSFQLFPSFQFPLFSGITFLNLYKKCEKYHKQNVYHYEKIFSKNEIESFLKIKNYLIG